MQVKEIMTPAPVAVSPGESVEVAARTLAQYNVGVLPVCRGEHLCGLVTDRDLVTRCLAANLDPHRTEVRKIMTKQVISVPPEMDAGSAACLMGLKQVRRLPVVDGGKILGMVSLGDVAVCREQAHNTAAALAGISSNVTEGKGNPGQG